MFGKWTTQNGTPISVSIEAYRLLTGMIRCGHCGALKMLSKRWLISSRKSLSNWRKLMYTTSRQKSMLFGCTHWLSITMMHFFVHKFFFLLWPALAGCFFWLAWVVSGEGVARGKIFAQEEWWIRIIHFLPTTDFLPSFSQWRWQNLKKSSW